MSAFTDAVADRTGHLHAFSVGACSNRECCGEYDDEGEFRWWPPCFSCGSTFGGNRHPAHYLVDGEIERERVCVDCLLYHANGDEPEDWRAHP